jgi:pimeloyl-ACP methyl ester carboxylesterase
MPLAQGIHYTLHSQKDALSRRPPLILIHGAGGSFLSWHPFQRRLEGETVYTLDLPGHASSEGESRQFVGEYAADVAGFMENLAIESAVIVGHSMGSGIALTLALEYPHKVRALALMGGGAKLRVAPFILTLAGSLETFPEAVERINRACFGSHTSDELLGLSKKNMLNTRPSVLHNDLLACDRFDVITRLANIHVPALILCGTEDEMTPPRSSQYLKDNLPNAQLHFLEATGHMLMLEQPETVVKLLKQFLDEIPPLS